MNRSIEITGKNNQAIVFNPDIDESSYQQMMKDVYSTSVSKQTLDEAPTAYNKQKRILELAEPTIEVLEYLRPIYNLKA